LFTHLSEIDPARNRSTEKKGCANTSHTALRRRAAAMHSTTIARILRTDPFLIRLDKVREGESLTIE
jgi:hypothetical protein